MVRWAAVLCVRRAGGRSRVQIRELEPYAEHMGSQKYLMGYQLYVLERFQPPLLPGHLPGSL